MEMSVKMTSSEFLEFEEWRKERGRYEIELNRVRGTPEMIASSLSYAVESVEGKTGKFKIVDHEHMGDAWDMIQEFLPD